MSTARGHRRRRCRRGRRTRRRLEQRNVRVRERVGRGEAGDARADDRDAHAAATLPPSVRPSSRCSRYAARVREVDLDGLPALLDKPRGARAALVLAHGAGAGMRHAFLQDVADALAERRIATLRYEFPYMTPGGRASIAPTSPRPRYIARGSRHEGSCRRCRGSPGRQVVRRTHDVARARSGRARRVPRPDFPRLSAASARAARGRDGARRDLPLAAGPLLFLQGTRDALAPLETLRPIIASLGPRATLHVVDGADHGYDVLVRSGRTPRP